MHGGYGYTREYDVEQLYRDNRLNPIHEGTHGIQALDLLGRKVVMQGGAGLAAARRRRSATRSRGPRGRRRGGRAAPPAGRRGGTGSARSPRHCGAPATRMLALANASVYLEAVGHIVVAWMWLEQVLAAGTAGDGDFHDGKRAGRAGTSSATSCPGPAPQLDLLESLDRTTLDMRAGLVLTGLPPVTVGGTGGSWPAAP